MKRHLIPALAIMAGFALPAAGQAIVIGGGLAKDCYESVEAGTGQTRQVEQTCTRALTEETMTRANRAATYVNRGIVRMRDGRHDAALSDYDRALRIEPELGAAYLNRGAALIHQKRFEEALAALDRAIELETKELYAAHYNRAIARERTGDVEGAYSDFLKASELKPDWELVKRQLERFTVVEG